ncbi:hypothetical protein D3C76_1553600 [compost metagenome]
MKGIMWEVPNSKCCLRVLSWPLRLRSRGSGALGCGALVWAGLLPAALAGARAASSLSTSALLVAACTCGMKPGSSSLVESSASTSIWWLAPPAGEAIMKKSLEGCPSSAP